MKYIVFFLLLTANLGWGYTLYPPPEDFVAERKVSFRIISESELEIGELPDHPKIIWLGHSLSTERSRLDDFNLLNPGQQRDLLSTRKMHELGSLNELTISFMAVRAGAIQMPPVPVSIDGKTVYVSLPDLVAHKNLLPKGHTRFFVTYNGEPEPPKVVRVGSHLDVDIHQLIRIDKGNPYFSNPDMKIDNIEWLLYHRQTPRLMGDPRFKPLAGFGIYHSQNFEGLNRSIDGVMYHGRRYQGRGFFPKEGEVKGPIFASLGVRLHSKVHVEEFSVNVEPLPKKNVAGIDTGLIGDWSFEVEIQPKELKVGELFKVYVVIKGSGDHLNLRPLDFSSSGFSSVSTTPIQQSRKHAREWKSIFTQGLVPTGEVADFPAIVLANFDIKTDQWVNHSLSDSLAVIGAKAKVQLELTPVVAMGEKIGRPVWLNLNPLVFVLFACAPLLPFAAMGVKKLLSVRKPELAKRRKQRDRLVKQLKRTNCPESIVDEEVLPLLKEHFQLPQGLTARELADSVKDKHGDLADILDQHTKATFGSTEAKIDLQKLAKLLAKLAFVFVSMAGFVEGSELPEIANLKAAASAFESGRLEEAEGLYRNLAAANPDRPALFLNLTKTHLAKGDYFQARASCYTTLLLDPANGEARKLMNEILTNLGKPALPGTSLLSARPDQYLTIAAGIWFFAFLLFLFWRNRWVMAGLIMVAILIAGFGLWRNSNAYAANQYMVVTKELPREIELGVPDWNFASFESGEIVFPAELTETHARIEASNGDSFWLPLEQLEQVW